MTVETDGGDATVALSANGTIEQAAAESTEPQESDAAQERPADSDAAGESDSATADDAGDAEEELIEEGEIAGDYLEQLLDVLDFDGDIDLDVEGDRAIVSIDGGRDLSKLVGRRGEVLDALQELTRLAVQQATGVRSRLMLDVAGWRAKRREELSALGTAAAQRVLDSGKPESLAAMTPFERKIVHDAVAAVDGVESESEGVEPNRHVVVVPS
ncbi:protein jag [Nocardia sp. CA2R105]|uniref:Protein jag n=1 Tax=Nocardia jiangxiensis TaxID=282685 RepID=A0ABW6RWF1_9NOCA|nr:MULTISPECIES: protein jag [Nocardia]MBY8858839.1 protein jag [Nocardia coffeae]